MKKNIKLPLIIRDEDSLYTKTVKMDENIYVVKSIAYTFPNRYLYERRLKELGIKDRFALHIDPKKLSEEARKIILELDGLDFLESEMNEYFSIDRYIYFSKEDNNKVEIGSPAYFKLNELDFEPSTDYEGYTTYCFSHSTTLVNKTDIPKDILNELEENKEQNEDLER